MFFDLIPDSVPIGAAAGVGLLGLGAGLVFMRAAARDKLAAAHRLASAGSTYWVRAEGARRQVLAVETPTMSMPLVDLEAAGRTRAERLRAAALDGVERVREAVKPEPGPRDWRPGEMTAAFNKIVEGNEWENADTTTLPVQPSPWVSPLTAARRPAAELPPVVHAPREVQPAPQWETRPAPVPAQNAPSRGRLRAGDGPLSGYTRAWGSVLGPVPELALPKFPRPFRMPEPRQRLPHDPRRMAMLDPDDTRWMRVRRVQA